MYGNMIQINDDLYYSVINLPENDIFDLVKWVDGKQVTTHAIAEFANKDKEIKSELDKWEYKPKMPVSRVEYPESNIKLRPGVQEYVAKHVFNKDQHQLAIIAGTGIGKTILGLYSATKLKYKTLVICPLVSIQEQWIDTAKKAFNISADRIGIIKSPFDFNKDKDILFALAGTFTRFDVDEIYDNFLDSNIGLVIVDETHLRMKSIFNVQLGCPADKVLYLTGTFGRSSGDQDKLLAKMFDDISALDTVADPNFARYQHVIYKLSKLNINLSQIEIQDISVPIYGPSAQKYEALIWNQETLTERQKLYIDKIIQIIAHEKKRTLITVLTRKVAEKLKYHLQAKLPSFNIRVYMGGLTADEKILAKQADILIGTFMSTSVGFDVKGLIRVINIVNFKSPINTIQLVGRLRELDDKSDTSFHDLIPSNISQFTEWANKRKEALELPGSIVKELSFEINLNKYHEDGEKLESVNLDF